MLSKKETHRLFEKLREQDQREARYVLAARLQYGAGLRLSELVRACMSQHGTGFEAEKWREVSRIYRRSMGLALGRKHGRAEVESRGVVTKNTAEMLESKDNETALPDMRLAGMPGHRVRHFTDGAVIGSKAFVNEAFAKARERFSDRRKDGARAMRGRGRGAKSLLWSARDLRVRV